MSKKTKPSMAEMASRITAHLKRFEADPAVNAPQKGSGLSLKPYCMPSAEWRRSSRIYLRYADPLGQGTPLTMAEAREYLEFLDAGKVGKHWQVETWKAKERT